LKEQNKELKTEIDKLRNNEYELIELQNEYKILKNEKRLNKEKISKLQGKVKALEEWKIELDSLKKTHSDLEDEKKELKLEIKETRALLEKHKDENFSIKNKLIEKEKELKYSNLMKLELEALKKDEKQDVIYSNFEQQKALIEKDNDILRLQLHIKTLESDMNSLKDHYESERRELVREFQEERRGLTDANEQLIEEKESVEL